MVLFNSAVYAACAGILALVYYAIYQFAPA